MKVKLKLEETKWRKNEEIRQSERRTKARKRKKKQPTKYSEYEPKWTGTEIYNEGLGIDMLINFYYNFRTPTLFVFFNQGTNTPNLFK